MKPKNTPRICFVTLGCAKNEVDSFHMRNAVVQAGYTLVKNLEDADVIIINTCSFIQSATEESLEAIFQVADLPRVIQGSAKLVVAGCMPARYGDDLEEELHEVSTFIPCNKEDNIVEILGAVCRGMSVQECDNAQSQETHKYGFWKTPSAYVKISDGCDRFCSYCAIPFIRGPYKSFELETILNEVDELVLEGIREIVLVAQDSGRWGEDLESELRLADLLSILAKRHPRTWFRIMYLQPEGVTNELLEAVDSHDNICPYFDIPLQHIDEDILIAMNRSGSAQAYLALLAHIRSKVADASLRTTLISGFPGESDEAHTKLCDFLEEAEFDYVGVFPYSAEEGTRAATYSNHIDEEVKLERTQQLRDIADSISFSRIKKHIGQNADILVLGREEDGQLYGRVQSQAPDVDGVVYVNEGEIGQINTYTITDVLLYEMEGVRCV